jgi:ankyrin repeat domain-containing protein 50
VKEIEILKSLGTFPYQERKDRNPDRIKGTCEWFVAHELFRDWRESKSSRMLWVSADPGCGKSVLTKYLVDSVLATTESRTTCYFFFKDDFEDQKSIVSALRCILQQLFLQKRVLLSETILERFEINGEKFTSSFSELWDALISAAKDKNAGEIVCLLDAIDECEDYGRSQLTQALCKLYGTRRSFNLKFLLTSRPYGGIRRSFQPLEIREMPVIHLSGESDVEMEKISGEIDIFIKARVQSIKAQLKLRHDEEELLLRGVMDVRNRTYLWVHLTLDLIESDTDINKTGIAEAISCLPKSVDEAYERILSKSSNSEEAKKLLHIIVAAVRPLTLKEMSIALALRENHQSYGNLDLKSEDRFRENIRDLCGLFVTIRDTRMYLLHQTAKEFLVQNNLENHPKSIQTDLKWKNSLTPQESHRILLEICIWHLLFTEFEEHPFNVNETLFQYVDSHIFLDYSAKHWTVHFHESHVKVDGVVQSLLRICDTGSNCCLTWFRIYWMSTHADFPENFTNLMIASYFGLGKVVKLLLRMNGVDLNSKDSINGRSALSWAAGNGFNVTVKLLIKGTQSYLPFRKGVEVNSIDKYGRTPLSYAAWNGHVDIVKLLLKAGAWVDSTDEIGGVPLSYAICNGHETVVKLLLKSGTQIDSKNNIGKMLLLSAAEKGHEAVVRLLLEKDAELEIKSDYYSQMPLSRAAEKGHIAVVRLLVEKGAELETKSDGRTPLSWAAKEGHEAVVRFLLEKGAKLETKSNYGQTSLLYAAKNGYEEVVRLLLEKGAELETKSNYGQTPLLYAAMNGYEEVVRLLLEKGAELETKWNYNQTPLLWATRGGHEVVVRLLLEKGAKLETKSNYGRTPLSYAAKNGYEKVVRLLLEKGAELETKCDNNQTPLSYAAENGHEEIVRMLLENGAELETKSFYNQTPLSFAAENGHEEIVRMLLKNGAELETNSFYNQTPLSLATIMGHKVVVRLLLEKGAC